MPPVLVVDDSRAQRRLLVKTLSNWGYDTIEAGSGEEALEICAGRSIDIVISDWMMPGGMSGVEFCKAFRSLSDRPAYFVLLTAQTDRERLAEGLESGADDFLSKPFHAVELRARLRAGARVVAAQRALATKVEELSNAYAAIDRDLRGARAFQEGLVPERHVRFGSVDVSLLFQSSGHVGGDLVGYFRAGAGEIGVFSVDVSGHGVASALMTARIAGYLSDAAPDRNIALRRVGDGFAMLPLIEVCRRLNQILQADVDHDQYLTMSLARVDLTTGKVLICQAGHPSPAVQRRGGGITFLDMPSTPLGLVDDVHFAMAEVALAPGDRVVLYSDGITECPGPGDTMLEEAGLERILAARAEVSGPALVEELRVSLVEFAGRADFPDDLSAVVIERR
jgi:sigma-B regulation protein RsbU (phosphoserine phosphatase)